MTTITIKVPETLGQEHGETVRFIAAKLYESGKLTLGQAAEMAEMKKWDFAEILINYGVYFMNASAEAAIDDAKGI